MTQSITADVGRARGKVSAAKDGVAVFRPANTNYELHLSVPEGQSPPAGPPVEGEIRAAARKVFTVPSGGNFVEPIVGVPRIIQGRVRRIDGNRIIVHAGTPFVVTLPEADSGIDLARGPVAVNAMVNVTLRPGAELIA